LLNLILSPVIHRVIHSCGYFCE